MDFTGSNSEGGGYERPAPGLSVARIYKIVDLGTQEDTFQGQPKKARKMLVWWELAQLMSDGRPFSIFLEYNQFLGSEKAKLRKHLESWAGCALTPDDIKAFDPKAMMLGKACMVNLVKNEAGKVKVDGIMAIPAGVTKPQPVNPHVFLDLDKFDGAAFDALPEWVKDKIMLSPEWKRLQGHPAPAMPAPSDDVDSDSPFGNRPASAPAAIPPAYQAPKDTPPADGAPANPVALGNLIQSAANKASLDFAWVEVLKAQAQLSAEDLMGLSKLKKAQATKLGL